MTPHAVEACGEKCSVFLKGLVMFNRLGLRGVMVCVAISGMAGCAGVIDTTHADALRTLATWKGQADGLATAGAAEKKADYQAAEMAVNGYIEGLKGQADIAATNFFGHVELTAVPADVTAKANQVLAPISTAAIPIDISGVLRAISDAYQQSRQAGADTLKTNLDGWKWADWNH